MAKKSNSSSKKESAPRLRLSKNARASFLFIALISLGVGTAAAYPLSPTPAPSSTPSPSPTPGNANVLPFDSTLVFVLDDAISSKSSQTGHFVNAHLKDAIVLGGRVVAPADTPVKIKIVSTSKADIGDVYGFVDIFFEPLALPDGRTLPLRAPASRLAPHRSAGHESTVAIEDTIEDQVIPYHYLWHIFRSGKNFVLNPGSEVGALTEATLTALPNGTIAIETPPPPVQSLEMPKSTFPVQPLATPFGPNGNGTQRHQAPAPTPTPTPSVSPSPTPSS